MTDDPDSEANGGTGDAEGEAANGASPAVESAEETVIEALARSAEIYGMNRSYGRLFGILYFAEEPLSLDDLVEESGYAKSTISTAMRSLERLHFVRRRSIPGEGKKAFFEAETDFWRIFQQLLDQEVRREIDLMTRALDEAEDALEDVEGERAERDLERVRSLQRVYDQSETLIALFTSQPIDRIISALQRVRRS